MPTSKSHRIIEEDESKPDALVIPVTVERTVGEVTIGEHGLNHPLIVAFQIIAEYEADKGEGGTYRFQDSTITIDHGQALNDLGRWLELHHPSIFANWVTGA